LRAMVNRHQVLEWKLQHEPFLNKGLLMKSLLDDQTIELTCPHCAHKFKERIGKLKTNPTLTCSGCHQSITIRADQFRNEIAKVDKSLADLRRTLGRLGK